MKRSISAQEARRLKEIRQTARALLRQLDELTAEAYRLTGVSRGARQQQRRDFVFDVVNEPDFCTIDKMLRILNVRVRPARTTPARPS